MPLDLLTRLEAAMTATGQTFDREASVAVQFAAGEWHNFVDEIRSFTSGSEVPEAPTPDAPTAAPAASPPPAPETPEVPEAPAAPLV